MLPCLVLFVVLLFLLCVLFDVCACLCPKSDNVSFIVSVQVNGF